MKYFRKTLVLCCIALAAAAGCSGAPEPGTDAFDAVTADNPAEDQGSSDSAIGEDTVGDESPGDTTQPHDSIDPADSVDGSDAADDVEEVHVGPPDRVSESFDVKAGLEQVYIRNATADWIMQLVDVDGNVTHEGTVDELGSLVLRNLNPARGYSVRPAHDPDDYTGPLHVRALEGSTPPESYYSSQVLAPGFGYLEVRDGTKLSYFMTLPGPIEDGPYPTVISYSGYAPSMPGKVVSPDVEPFCEIYPILCNAPDDPSNMIAALMGFATVGVNMRGTGCSDGAYDYFEPLQTTDGYDVVEIVAHQPWVKNHKVGMVGISFPGIAQLFVASANPPSLAAIAPQSVLADSASSTLLPGGIYNNGFAKKWHDAVLNYARPWDPWWTTKVIEDGDPWCDIHQRMHGQQRDAIAEAMDHPYYTDEVAKPVDPTAWVDKINVPIFLTGQWHDEQTGPHFPALMDKFTNSPNAHFTVTNGFHNDAAAPQVLIEWMEFLWLFVAGEKPVIPDDLKGLGAIFMGKVFGSTITFPDSPLEDAADFDAAMAMWNERMPLRVIFESGADPDVDKALPQGTFEERFQQWPIPETQALRWWLQPGGMLGEEPGADGGASAFEHDPLEGAGVTLLSSDVYRIPPDWNWPQPQTGKAASFITPPLAVDLVMVGHGSVDLWIRSSHAEADLEVTVTEVRPDGKENLVQSGWLRASHRALRDDATELRPVKTHREEDVQPLVPGEWVLARVEIMPMGHIFRAGSRIRLIVDTPGFSMASWQFANAEFDTPPVIDIGHDAEHPSSVALPLINGVEVPTEMPACDALRGQPCRDYIPFENAPAE